MVMQTLQRLVAPVLTPFIRRPYLWVADELEVLSGKRDRLTPPQRLHFVGPGDFRKIGQEFLGHFRILGALKPNDRVLDVGCGVGRMAVPLTRYLTSGSYEGIDIVGEGIEWCQKNINRRFPNFRFRKADVCNQHYNPTGKHKAAEYRFPFEDESFNFVFLTSVFTHMLPPDMANYFREIARLMKNGARCLITYYLMNDEARRGIRDKQSSMNFSHKMEGYLTTNPEDPESVLAYEEQYILELYEGCNLRIWKPMHYGSWCGRQNYVSYQDIIVAEKC